MTDDAGLRRRAEELADKLGRAAKAGGYNLNPDREMVVMLCEGLVQNIDTHGYMGCPCRLLEGDKSKDLDIICPCDYRDPDLGEFGCCYCALYVSSGAAQGKVEIGPIPERRPPEDQRGPDRETSSRPADKRVWRCKVCGYLCGREHPPGVCPVCKAKKERFEEFGLAGSPEVWRCKVCGYLASRDNPPDTCPICKADKERFGRLSL